MHVEHPITTARALDLAERIEGENVARWLAAGANPFRWTDPRHEPAQREIERQRVIRVAREKRHG